MRYTAPAQLVQMFSSWLGLISYSVYLLHPLLLELYRKVAWLRHDHPIWLQTVLAVAFGIVLIGVSSLTYLGIEQPMQNLGRRFARWLDRRFGPDRVRDQVPAGEPVMVGGRARTAVE